MLEIKNIYKSFGEQKILQDLCGSFEQGKIHTLVGGNGTGKTTIFNIISGFLKPDKGEIWYKGKRLDNHSPVVINAKGITRTFQDLRIINQLTVKENVLLSFKNNPGERIINSFLPSGIFRKQYADLSERANTLLQKIHLKEVENNLAEEISYGQQKLLTIGCCIANNADLLLLDEPVAGIDKDNYQRIYELIIAIKKEGKTIIQIEHNQEFVANLSDIVWFLNSGQIKVFSDYSSFVNDPIVKATYLN